jgi:hypothetical protein
MTHLSPVTLHLNGEAYGHAAGRFPPFIEYVPILFVMLAGFSLAWTTKFMAAALPSKDCGTDACYSIREIMSGVHATGETFTVFLCSLTWLVSMGCTGAIASLGMKAINIPDIETRFDISNRRLAVLRVALGGLFALVLTFPFTCDPFIDFCYQIGTGMKVKGGSEEGPYLLAILLIAPFLFGFSTSLVMLVINQLNTAVLAFFGRLGTGLEGGETTVPGPTADRGSRAA